MTKTQVIYWRDIPVQVRVKNGRSRKTHPLSPRFQKTVYRAAYRAKAINGDAYTNAWHSSTWGMCPMRAKIPGMVNIIH